MDTIKRINGTAERLAKMSGDSYKMLIEHMVAQQERNVRYKHELLDGTAREIRY